MLIVRRNTPCDSFPKLFNLLKKWLVSLMHVFPEYMYLLDYTKNIKVKVKFT